MGITRVFQVLGLAVLFAAPVSGAPSPVPLAIALGSFGNEDFAKAYRVMIEDSLLESGFKVVAETEHPDATLAGAIALAFGNRMGGLDVRLIGVLRLTAPEGKVVWSWRTNGHQEPQDWPPDVVVGIRKAIKSGEIKLVPVHP